MQKGQKLPKRLQGVLYSTNIDQLNLDKDKSYIIHQIFSHGRMEDMKWLFTVYSKEELKDTFSAHPFKDYSPAMFNFVKNYLLGLESVNLDPARYVRNIPRAVG